MISKPKICLISQSYMDGGYHKKLELISSHVDLILISPEHRCYPHNTFQRFVPRDALYCVQTYSPAYFPPGRYGSTGWFLSSIDLNLRALRPNIIHVESELHSNIALQTYLYRNIFSSHSKVVLFFWANQKIPGKKGIIIRALQKFVASQVDFYIAGNTDGSKIAMQSGVSSHRIEIIPQIGVDTEQFFPLQHKVRETQRKQFNIEEEDFAIGFVGRFVPEKGIEDLFCAVKMMMRRLRSNKNVQLLFLGQGPLSDRVFSWKNASSFVQVLPPTSYQNVALFIQVLDVLVLPSRTMSFWKEQFGHVLIEAMACGVPVIGSDSGAIQEVIGDAGIVFPEGDADSLTEALLKLYHDKAYSKGLGLAGRQRVLSQFSDEVIAEKTLDVYQRVLSNHRSQR